MLLEAGGIDDIEVPGYEKARREQGQLWEKERGEVKGDATGRGKGSGKGEDGGDGLTAQVTEDIREWDYGDYEGITSKEIKKMRQEKGEKEWEIWRDGCPGGEYVFTIPSQPSSTIHPNAPALHHSTQIPQHQLTFLLPRRSPEQITTRLDHLISEIRTKVHAPALKHIQSGSDAAALPCDVLVVAHGHILRAFAARWVGRPVHDNPSLLLEAGGVGTLR